MAFIRRAADLAALSLSVSGLLSFAGAQTPAASPSAAAPIAAPPIAAAPIAYVPTSLVAEPGLPRTRVGHIDFSDGAWTSNFFPVFEATPLAATLVISPAQAKKMIDMMLKGLFASNDPDLKIDPEIPVVLGGVDGLPMVRGEFRSRLVVLPSDGKLPWTQEGKAESKTGRKSTAPANDPEGRPSGERCTALLGLAPISAAPMLDPLQIIEAPGYVVIHTEFGDEARVIPLSEHHGDPALAPRLGDSIARWEGDTLVIETIGSPGVDQVRDGPMTLVVNPSATVIERLTRLSRDELLYQFTVVDPKTYSAPWLAEYSLRRTDKPLFPYSCHEGNYSLPNILKAQRMADRAQAAK